MSTFFSLLQVLNRALEDVETERSQTLKPYSFGDDTLPPPVEKEALPSEAPSPVLKVADQITSQVGLLLKPKLLFLFHNRPT